MDDDRGAAKRGAEAAARRRARHDFVRDALRTQKTTCSLNTPPPPLSWYITRHKYPTAKGSRRNHQQQSSHPRNQPSWRRNVVVKCACFASTAGIPET
ncbi:unnamed protein product, partial [Iphiclides podalirius]